MKLTGGGEKGQTVEKEPQRSRCGWVQHSGGSISLWELTSFLCDRKKAKRTHRISNNRECLSTAYTFFFREMK
jgi:hypothetical protein